MLEARSVAVVGASERPGSFGQTMMRQLLDGGFRGPAWPVNPRYDAVMGRQCHDSIEELPEPVDLALLGVPNARLEEAMGAAARAGARAAVIFASCYEDARPGVPPLSDRLARIAHDAGMAVCGANCMGFLNLAGGLRACGFEMPLTLDSGGITFISHSGSAFSAMAYNDRGLRFNALVSAGQELNTTAAAYLEHALSRDDTEVVALFLETVRDPARFCRALEIACARDVPVVVLKVGRKAAARELVTAHSGALAGEDAAYEAVFRTYGVLRVRSLDEMADTVELLAARRRAAPGGLASIHDSGGERAGMVDAAADAGVRLARPSEETTSRLAAALEEGLPPVNPLDAWGTGNDYEAIFEQCMHALLDDADTAALAFSVDLTTQEEAEAGYVRCAKRVFAATDKPMAVLSNMAAAIDRRDATSLRAAGVPVLEGTYGGLAAFRHLFALRDARAQPPLAEPEPVARATQHWRRRLAEPHPLTELEALAMLRDHGIRTIAARAAESVADAVAAAEELGWPVALKTAAPSAQHKSAVGGVALGLANADALRASYVDITARLGPSVVVEAMAEPGFELALGVVRDEQFGPLVMVSAGGVLIEALDDRAWALPPLDDARAAAMIEALRCRPLLDGTRGMPAADVASVARTLARLSSLALTLGDRLDALDVNPLLAGPSGCVAVDALVVARGTVPRPTAPGGSP
jgi:acyl-CoA synthetase (NDP forming)